MELFTGEGFGDHSFHKKAAAHGYHTYCSMWTLVLGASRMRLIGRGSPGLYCALRVVISTVNDCGFWR